MRKDLPEQTPVLSFFSRPIPNSHQVIDDVHCLKSTIDVYNAYNNERTRLNFGIFYSVVKNRWANIASQWNTDKVFNIVGHYAAAKQGYITVNATEIDYEDINKPSNTSSESGSTFSDSHASVINRFYNSLTLEESSTTSSIHNPESDTSPSFQPTSHSSTSTQEVTSTPIIPNITTSTTSSSTTTLPSTTSTSIAPNIATSPSIASTTSTTPLQSSNPSYIHPQYYHQFINPTNLPDPNNPTLIPYPHLPYFNPMLSMHSQFPPNLQQSSSTNTTGDPNISQSTSSSNNNPIIEEIPAQQNQKSSRKKRKKDETAKETNLKKVRTRSDTKLHPNPEDEETTEGVMSLALTSLSKDPKDNESD